MSQAWVSIVLFVFLLAFLPMGFKWLQHRIGKHHANANSVNRIVSVMGVGPQQRVVTVEVGPEGERVWLILGVTPQNITCLHRTAAPAHGPGLTAGFGDATPKNEPS